MIVWIKYQTKKNNHNKQVDDNIFASFDKLTELAGRADLTLTYSHSQTTYLTKVSLALLLSPQIR